MQGWAVSGASSWKRGRWPHRFLLQHCDGGVLDRAHHALDQVTLPGPPAYSLSRARADLDVLARRVQRVLALTQRVRGPDIMALGFL
eukprot:7378744-Prymnesium_polylepis.3